MRIEIEEKAEQAMKIVVCIPSVIKHKLLKLLHSVALSVTMNSDTACEAIIRLKSPNKPISDDMEWMLGVAIQTIWYILKNKEGSGELRNTKRPERL